MSSTKSTACLFCGGTATLKSVTAAVQLDCPECGSYEVTVGAIAQLRSDTRARGAVLAEIRRQIASGVERPSINIETLAILKAH